MARDRSLDEFFEPDEDEDQKEGAEPDAETEEKPNTDPGTGANPGTDPETAPNQVAADRSLPSSGVDPDIDPPGATYEWTWRGAACEECGAVVNRRWREGDLMVCSGCKDW